MKEGNLINDNSLKPTNESRHRNRLDYYKTIFCFKYLTSDGELVKRAPFLLKTLDISYSGVGLESNARLEINNILVFNLEYNGVIREFKVQLQWCKLLLSSETQSNYKFGASFIELTYDDILFLNELLTHL